ncbi:MAG: DUF4097 domain-containing protein [Gemmatimonadota bacterium]
MLTILAAGALAALTLVQQSDTTVAVARGTRLELDNFAGEAVVRTWDRDAVRVSASHGTRESIDVQLEAGVLSVSAEGEMGPSGLVDFQLSVPAWMPLELSGVHSSFTVEGVRGDVEAETVEGFVRVRGGSGLVSLASVQGPVELQGARGRIEVSSVNESVTVRGSEGDVTAETVNGSVTLEGLRSDRVEASTVNGSITYGGAIRDEGYYGFETHNGAVTVTMPEGANATVSVSTFQGELESNLPVRVTGSRRDGSFSFVLGTGSARVEVESFQGLMRLIGAGSTAAVRPVPGLEGAHGPRTPGELRPPLAPRAPRVPRAPRAPRAPQAPRGAPEPAPLPE